MSRVAYVNGRYESYADAGVHIDDRGYQFADGVYEVIAVINGRMLDEEPHLDRLDRSLSELRMAAPMSRAALKVVLRETLRQNRIRGGIIYVQVTRGVAKRDHPFPKDAVPSLVVTARRIKGASPAMVAKGVEVVTRSDLRWGRPDIKSIALLPNILAKQSAREHHAYEAWLVDDKGHVTEGSSTNAWIVSPAGELITHPADRSILNGITRMGILAAAGRLGITVIERPFSVAEAQSAKEAFLSSTTSHLMPVVAIDGASVGNGHPGEITLALRQAYLQAFGLESGEFK